MLKQIQNIINNSKELNKYRIDCEEFNKGFVIEVPEDVDYLGLKEHLIQSILHKVIKIDSIITKINIERGYPGCIIGVQAINIKEALDRKMEISAETLFKLKMKQLEII